MGSFKIGYVLAIYQQLDRTRASTFTRNKSTFVERHDHVVDGWWRDAEESLEVGLRWSPPVNFRVVVDECEILALFKR